MKKLFVFAVVLIAICTLWISAAAAESIEVKMTIGDTNGYVNGEAKALDAPPIIRQDRTMLPVRFVAESLGATVAWDGATSTATITSGAIEIQITIGSATATVSGVTKALDAPAFIENSRTYMPVRFVAESLGATVAWDGATSTATITKGSDKEYFSTDFSDPAVLDEFTSYRGNWSVRDGRLYFDSLVDPATTDAAAFILFNRPSAAYLTDYMIDVDMYNIQTQGGLIIRSDLAQANDANSHGHYGYVGFIGYSATVGAIGYASTAGKWGNNLTVSGDVFAPGDDLHINLKVVGTEITCTYSDIATGEVLLTLTATDTTWSAGTFGIRLHGDRDGRTNFGTVSFDNLVVTQLN